MSKRLTVIAFQKWFHSLPEVEDYILATLCNDEVSTDEELLEYFQSEDIELIKQLLKKRDYFLDFRFTKNLL